LNSRSETVKKHLNDLILLVILYSENRIYTWSL